MAAAVSEAVSETGRSETTGASRVSEYASALRRKRSETGVVLPDIARKTGYDIADLLRMETGAIPLESSTFSRITAAISQLVREKTHG
jgi:predicted transcriptional regulator